MKVILLQDVKNQGKKDQVINVSEGYANNFLISKGLAVAYTKGSKERLSREINARNQNEENLISQCQELAKKLDKVEITFTVKTGKEDKVFGTISSKHIADELKKQGFEIDKKKICIDTPIDTIGVHTIIIKLHKRVECNLKVILKK